MGPGGGAKAPVGPLWQSVDGGPPAPTAWASPAPGPNPGASAAPHPPLPRQAGAGTASGSGNPAAVPAAPTTPPAPSAPGAPSGRMGFAGGTLIGTITELSEQRYETVNTAGNQVVGQVARGLLSAPFKAVGFLAGLLFAPLRFLLMPSLSPSRRPTGADRMQVPGTPFVLRTDDGQETECYLRGEITGGFIRLGDRVEVTGRVNPSSRVLRVSSLVNQRTRAVTRGHVDPRARFAPMRAVMAVLFLFAVVLLLSSWFR